MSSDSRAAATDTPRTAQLESGVHVADAREIPLPDSSVDCIVTSPPYNCGIDYDGVSDSFDPGEYENLVEKASAEMARVLKPGGRLWLNCLHNLPTYDDLEKLREGRRTKTRIAKMEEFRFDPFTLWRVELAKHLQYRDVIVWLQPGGDAATAWGSYLSPNAPNIRGRWEPILLMFKGTWNRGRTEGKNDLTAAEFMEFTKNVWEMPSQFRNGHPAPFPKRLPHRAIKLSTWPGDVVLDPFCGSGTTVRVAKDLGRVGIGFDLSPAYVQMANDRLAQEVLAV